MTDKQIIDMLIIYDGINEYKADDIHKSKELTSFFNQCRLQLPNSLLHEIAIENGNIIINTNTDFNKISIDLKNVSDELYDQFYQQYMSGLL